MCFGLLRQQFQAGGGAPHFAIAGCDSRAVCFFCLAEERREALEDIGLLIAIEATRNAAPEDPPIDFVLHLVAELQAASVDAARLLDAEIVAGEAEAGTQTEAAEIEPADFVRRRSCGDRRASARNLSAKRANVASGQDVAAEAERLLEPGGKLLRAGPDRFRERVAKTCSISFRGACAAPSALTTAAGCGAPCCSSAVLRIWNCRRQRLSLIFDSAPGFERSDFGEPRAELYRNQPLAAFAETNDRLRAARARCRIDLRLSAKRNDFARLIVGAA